MTAEAVLSWLRELEIDKVACAREIRELPNSCADGVRYKKAEIKDVADFLFDEGIAAQSIDDLVNQMDDITVTVWSQADGDGTPCASSDPADTRVSCWVTGCGCWPRTASRFRPVIS